MIFYGRVVGPPFPPTERYAPLPVYPGMNLSLLFWVLYIISVIFSLYQNRTALPVWAGGSLIQFILIGILGWQVFGAAVHR